jgi:solute carrier family 25 uncoupling protein 8/9
LTIPLDTAKVRLQIQGQKKAELGDAYIAKYKGMSHSLRTIFIEEGPKSLWKGIFAGLQRQCIFAGLRIGLYPTVRDFIVGTQATKEGKLPTLPQRILAGLITGAFGIAVASPTDVVKIRLQAEGKKDPGVPRRYKGSLDAYSKIVKEEGVKGLYSGLFPNIIRNSIMNAAELASYDQIKSSLIKKFPNVNPDSKMLHFFCGLSAGFIAVVFASPVDVIKTRVMNVIYILIYINRILKNMVELFHALLKH